MDSNNNKGIELKIKEAVSVAIFLPGQPSFDQSFAAMALSSSLKLAGKEPVIYCDSRLEYSELSSHPLQIKDSLASGQELTIKVSSAESQPTELRYEKKEDGLYIHLKSVSGNLTAKHVTAKTPAVRLSLGIVIGAPELEALGSLLKEWPETFFETELIALSNDLNHSYFGVANYVNPNSLTVSEMVMDFMTNVGLDWADQNTATLLFAGMVSGSNNFKSARTSPSLLNKASGLMSVGADHTSVVRLLYKTKSLSSLQLWGRVLARVENVNDGKILFSHLIPNDFEKTGASHTGLIPVMAEMSEMGSRYEAVIIFADSGKQQSLHVVGKPYFDTAALFNRFEVNQTNKEHLSQGQIYHWSYIEASGLEAIKAKILLAGIN